MRVKISAVCMVLILIVTLFAACQQSASPSSVAPSAPAATNAPASAASPAASEEAPAAGSAFLSEELVELSVMRDDGASSPLIAGSASVLYVEEHLNVKLVQEAVPAASYDDKVKVLISTDNMPDVMKVSLADVKQFAREDMFVNLSENQDKVPNFFAVMDANPDVYKLGVDGQMYSFPVMRRPSLGDDPNGQQPVIRSDLIRKYNLEYPKSFEELYEVLKVLKENNPDKIPLTNRKSGDSSGTQKVLDTMAYPLGSGSKMYYDHDIEGGKYIYGPAHENFKEVLRYLNRLYAEGLMDPDYATNTSDIWREKMSSGKAFMYMDNSGFRMDFETALKTLEPEATYDVFPTMSNSFGQTRNFIYEQHWQDQHYVIATSSEKIDLALAYFNWAFSDEGCNVLNYGVPGEHFDVIDGVPTMKTSVWDEFIATGSNAPAYDMASKLGLGLSAFTPYVDVGAQELMKQYMLDEEGYERLVSTIEMNKADPGLRAPVYDPPLSEEDTERFIQLESAVKNILLPEYDKYIMGLEPIDNYDDVIERARAAGAQEMEDIFNAANAAYK